MAEKETDTKGIPELGIPQYLPKNILELKHRRIVNQEGQPLIIYNGYLYWAGSGKLIGPVSILKPTCPAEYYFCDFCAGTFTMADSADEHQMSLAKHFFMEHRDMVIQRVPQPKGWKGGFWTPTDEALMATARTMAGEHPEVKEKDPMPVIQPVQNLQEASKKQPRNVKLVTEPAAGK